MKNQSFFVCYDHAETYRLYNSSVDESDNAKVIHNPSLSIGDLSEYIEIIQIQPGMHLHITKIPPEVEFKLNFEIKQAPLSFICWMRGSMGYRYISNNAKEKQGEVPCPEGYIVFGSAGKELGFSEKTRGDTVEFVQLMMDPSVLHMTLQDSMKGYECEYHNYLYKTKPENSFVSLPMPSSIYSIAKSISECSLKQPLRNFVLANKANELFYTIIMELLITKPKKATSHIQPEDISKFNIIKDYIEENLTESLSHSQLARRAGINEFKLKAGFKELYGNTVYGYVIEKRMQKAKSLLESGDYSVSDTAWHLGYTNVSHFISSFKKHHNITPGKFLSSIKQRLKNCYHNSI